MLHASGAAEANFLTASTVARGRSLLGERGEELDTIVVHPSVAYYLYQVGMLTFSTSALSTGTGIQQVGGGVGITDRSATNTTATPLDASSLLTYQPDMGNENRWMNYDCMALRLFLQVVFL